VVPPRSAGRPTEDRVDLGAPPPSLHTGFGIDLAYGRQRHQVARVGDTAKSLEVEVTKTLSLDFEFDVQRLPSGKELDALVNEEEKAALGDAIDRVAREGLDSEATEAFLDAVDDLFGEYEDDLGLAEGELDDARDLLTEEVLGFFGSAEGVAGAPLLKPPGEGEIYERYSNAVDSLRNRIERGRRNVLEAAGHAQQVLAEFARDALDAPEEESVEKLTALGDFLSRLEQAEKKGGPDALRAEARERLLERPAPAPEAVESQVAIGKSFLAAVYA